MRNIPVVVETLILTFCQVMYKNNVIEQSKKNNSIKLLLEQLQSFEITKIIEEYYNKFQDENIKITDISKQVTDAFLDDINNLTEDEQNEKIDELSKVVDIVLKISEQ